MADLRPKEIEECEFAYDVFVDLDGLLDGTKLQKFLNALNCNPSVDRLTKFGVSQKQGEKKFKLDELLPIYSEVKKEKKDEGCFEDFLECLKLYDKEDNGKMAAGELSHCLRALGEKLTDAQVDQLFEDCLDVEDEEGEIDYTPFLKRLCGLDAPLDKGAKQK